MTEIIFEGKPLHVGDLVHNAHETHRVGKVVELDYGSKYPIIVEWENGKKDTYTIDGRFMIGNPSVLMRHVQREYRYVGQIGQDFFVTDDYFLTLTDAQRIIFGATILREIPESGRPVG